MMRTAAFILLITFALKGDHRNENSRILFNDFLNAEQQALGNINELSEAPKLFTGVQYAALQNYYMTMDPGLLRVPQERLARAIESTEMARFEARKKAGSTFPMAWQALDTEFGGRTRALMWDPNDPEYKKVWAAGVTGGLWYREDIFDDNSRWQIVDDSWEGLNISSLAYDPVNPEVFYAGTGEGQTARIIYRESGGRGFGILKSANGGQNWEVIASTRDFAYVTDIAIRNEEGIGVVYAAVSSGRYQGRNIESVPGDGLYRSADGGLTWEQVLPDIPGKDYSYAVSDIEITSSGRIFVGTGLSLDGDGAGRILFSDDAVNWTLYDNYVSTIKNEPFYNYPGRVILASAPSDPRRIYAFLTAAGGQFYSFKSPWCRYIIMSNNAGLTWTRVNMPEADGSWAYIAWHALSAAVHPQKPEVLIAGGLDLHKSQDAGQTWNQFSLWYNFNNDPSGPNYVHADHHVTKFRPGNPTDVLFTTDGGVFLSRNADNITPSVIEKNQGFNTLQYYSCAIHPQAGKYNFLAGAQDNGTVRYQDPNADVTIFDNVSYGDGTFCFIDEDNPDFQITSSQFNYLYVNEYAFRNQDSTRATNRFQTGIFLNPMDWDSRRNILFANDCNFYGEKADTLVRIWNLDGTPLSSRIPLNMGITVPLSAVKVSPYSMSSATVLAGTQDGRLFRIENADHNIGGNNNPVSVTEIGSESFPAGNISCVEYGRNEDQIMVIFSNYGIPSVWETLDGGGTWVAKEQNLPDMPVRWGVYHPGNSNQVMLATETGLWTTSNFGDDEFSWEIVENFPNVRVDMLKVRRSDFAMIAATHGRGLWYGTRFPLAVDQDPVARELNLYPNPASTQVILQIPGNDANWNYSLSIYDLQGREIISKSDFITRGNNDQLLDLSGFEEGQYMVVIRSEALMFTGKLIKVSH